MLVFQAALLVETRSDDDMIIIIITYNKCLCYEVNSTSLHV